jgi:hypothetical protein
VSAAYPNSAGPYRTACEIVERQRRDGASTEQLRTAFVYYRSLFHELLGARDEELKRAS